MKWLNWSSELQGTSHATFRHLLGYLNAGVFALSPHIPDAMATRNWYPGASYNILYITSYNHIGSQLPWETCIHSKHSKRLLLQLSSTKVIWVPISIGNPRSSSPVCCMRSLHGGHGAVALVDYHQPVSAIALLRVWRNSHTAKHPWTSLCNPTSTNTIEPCSKCLASWHQIRKYLHDCLRFAYAHILSCAELTLAYAHHHTLTRAPCLKWTQGFRTWLNCKPLLCVTAWLVLGLARLIASQYVKIRHWKQLRDVLKSVQQCAT